MFLYITPPYGAIVIKSGAIEIQYRNFYTIVIVVFFLSFYCKRRPCWQLPKLRCEDIMMFVETEKMLISA